MPKIRRSSPPGSGRWSAMGSTPLWRHSAMQRRASRTAPFRGPTIMSRFLPWPSADGCAQRFFARLDQRLAQSAFVAGPNFSIADITAFISVDFARWVKMTPAEEHRHLRNWYDAIALRP